MDDLFIREQLSQDTGARSQDNSDIWRATLQILESQIVETQLRVWIEPLELASIGVDPASAATNTPITSVVLMAPNDFNAQWIRDHHIGVLESALAQVLGKPVKITLSVRAVPKPSSNSMESIFSEPPTERSESPARGLVLHAQEVHPSDRGNAIDPRYTFESFVVGASNQFAHASAVAVSERPAEQYNPLFIYSPPGLGKTHLLHAIGNHLVKARPGIRVHYLSAESFVNSMIESLQHQKMAKFRSKFRDSFDVLLVDDIQFIAGKKQTEEEFFHTFNSLYSSKRQIVVTSDRPPKEIDKLEERIRTRFEWGLVADIHAPEIETRIAIIKAKAEREDLYIPDEVSTFLATHVKSNVRELEGILIRLQAQCSLSGAEISLEMARNEFKNSIPEESTEFTVETIQAVVCKTFNVKPMDLKSTSRSKSVSLPRQLAMYLIRKYTGLGFREIGSYFGGKDHTTVLHACVKIEDGLNADPEIRHAVETVQNQL